MRSATSWKRTSPVRAMVKAEDKVVLSGSTGLDEVRRERRGARGTRRESDQGWPTL